MLRLQGTEYSAADSMTIDPTEYGVDWDGPVSLHDDDDNDVDGVYMPMSVDLPISRHDLDELYTTIDPNAGSENFGIDLYVATSDFIASKLL